LWHGETAKLKVHTTSSNPEVLVVSGGDLLMSSKLTDEQIGLLDLRNERLSKTPNDQTQEYLADHRQEYDFEN
jgi:hypothetical protein